MKHMMFTRLSAAAAIVLACGSVATAVNYDVTGQAGQYAEVVVPTVVRGAGGSFVNATVYVPWIIDADLGPLQNSAVVQTVNGNLLGGVSTFSSDVFGYRSDVGLECRSANCSIGATSSSSPGAMTTMFGKIRM